MSVVYTVQDQVLRVADVSEEVEVKTHRFDAFLNLLCGGKCAFQREAVRDVWRFLVSGRYMKRLMPVLLALAAAGLASAAEPDFAYPETDALRAQVARMRDRGIVFTDCHIHLRGGMTAEKAAAREERSGIRSAVLENFGREWPLHDPETLRAFIDTARAVRVNGRRLPVGVQVNDRDWFQVMDPAQRARLDFILADTMIMGVTAEGKPRRLWLPGVTIDDPEAWMGEYLAHNLRILDEPISVLANPTYLPPCLTNRYDTLWTEARMRQVIAKAVAKGVALEIQAGSAFPKPAFLKLARTMGAKFAFGSNNFTPEPKDLSRWFEAVDLLDLRPADVWGPVARGD